MALKAEWHLDDLNDSSGNNETLASHGTVNFVAGHDGDCASATWSNVNYLDRAAFAWNVGLGDITVGLWFNKTSNPANDYTPTIMGVIAGANMLRPCLAKTTGYFGGVINIGGATGEAWGSTDVCDGTWHLGVITREGSTIKAYVDLVEVGSGGNANKDMSFDNIRIGWGTNATYDHIGQCLIDEIVIADTAWSIAEQKAYYYPIVAGGFSGFSPWIFMEDIWGKHDKIWEPKGILVPRLGLI